MENKNLPDEYTLHYFLTAGETDAQGRMPMWVVIHRVIEAAILHANALGVGYADLLPRGLAWVLTRISVEMVRYPQINETYSVTTWIEGYNRLYSDRCFLFSDADGKPIAHVRSMWVAIDMAKRTAADLTALDSSRFVVSGSRKCPVQRIGKPKPLADEAIESLYTWRYSDIDFNRHVNTLQYVRQVLNQWDMDVYDTHEISRFDISFHQECHYGDTALIRHADLPGSHSLCEIVDPQGRRAVLAEIAWKEINN